MGYKFSVSKCLQPDIVSLFFFRFVKVVEMLQSLNQEKCTWRLISSLYRDRLETEANAGNDEPMMIDMLVMTKCLLELKIL